MLWVDYRAKLGLEFSDDDRFRLLQSKMDNFLKAMGNYIPYRSASFLLFCLMTGQPFEEYHTPIYKIKELLSNNSNKLPDFLALYIAFVNTLIEKSDEESYGESYGEREDFEKREDFIDLLTRQMKESKISFEVQKDEKANEYFVFPQGAPELDDALVSEPLEWLGDYPQARKTFIVALKQYSEGIYIRDVADNFRKSLEEFLKEFFGNSKNLVNNIKEVGAFLKSSGGDSEITNILASMIVCYDKLNNKVAKHNDKVDAKFLEFLMYQTELFIRMLIVVKRAEKGEAE